MADHTHGSGIGRDPYSHLKAAPHAIEVSLANPNSYLNRAPGTAAPFTPTGPIHDGKANHAVAPDVNQPNRFELFILGEGENKINEVTDTRTPNTSTFTVNKEDHTLANLLRAHLLKDPHVIFSAYKVPHPLLAKFELRVQTDGEISPREAVVACAKGIVSDLGQLSREFTKEFELRKMVGGEGSGNAPEK